MCCRSAELLQAEMKLQCSLHQHKGHPMILPCGAQKVLLKGNLHHNKKKNKSKNNHQKAEYASLLCLPESGSSQRAQVCYMFDYQTAQSCPSKPEVW